METKWRRSGAFLSIYLLAFTTLALLTFNQLSATGRRISPVLILSLRMPLLLLSIVGAFFLARFLWLDNPSSRQSNAILGLGLHAYPLLAFLMWSSVYALPKVLQLDFTIRNSYYGTTIVDYTLVADPVLGVIILVSMAGYLITLRRWGKEPSKVIGPLESG